MSMMETLAELTAAVDFLESNVMKLRGDIRQTERAPVPPLYPKPFAEPKR